METAPATPAEWFVAIAGVVSTVDILTRLAILCAVVYVLVRQTSFDARLKALEIGRCQFVPPDQAPATKPAPDVRMRADLPVPPIKALHRMS